MDTLTLIYTLLGITLGFFAWSSIWFGYTPLFNITEGVWVGGISAYTIARQLISVNTSTLMPISAGNILLIIPLIIGILVFTRLTRYRWAARYALVVVAGLNLGLELGSSITANILANIKATVEGVIGMADPFNNILVLVGLIASLTYFTYSARVGGKFHGEGAPLRYITMFGRIILMISFGYMFAQLMITEGLDFLISTVIVLFRRTVELFQGL